MNMHITEHQRQAMAHKERKERLWNTKPQPAPKPVTTTIYVRTFAQKIPLWQIMEMTFDAHCENWKYHRQMSLSPANYIRRRSEELNISYKMMVGPSRMKEVSLRRQLIMWELMKNFKISSTQLGKLMGGRDHTTALHAYRKIDDMTDEQRSAIGPYYPKRVCRTRDLEAQRLITMGRPSNGE